MNNMAYETSYPCADCGGYDSNHHGGCSELEPDEFEKEERRKLREMIFGKPRKMRKA
jgi:hypothetical protein